MQHDWWLAWKLKRGLATRGRPGKLHPKGVAAKLLHLLWFKRVAAKAAQPPVGQKYFIEIDGQVGPTGGVNERS